MIALSSSRHHRAPPPVDERWHGRNGTPCCPTKHRDLDVSALVAALDHLRVGVIILDQDARVHFSNRATRELFVEQSRLLICEGILRTPRPSMTLALHRLIKAAAVHHQASTLSLDEAADLPLTITVTAHRQREPHLSPGRAIAFLYQPQSWTLDADELKHHFGLTSAEAAMAREVGSGAAVKECARRLGILYTTARTHLQHIFEKTGTRRQAELVRLLLLMGRPWQL